MLKSAHRRLRICKTFKHPAIGRAIPVTIAYSKQNPAIQTYSALFQTWTPLLSHSFVAVMVRSCHGLTNPPLPCEEDINPRMKEPATTTSYRLSNSSWTSFFFWFWRPPLSSFRTTWMLNIGPCFKKKNRSLGGFCHSERQNENSRRSLPSFGHAFFFFNLLDF